MIIVTTKYKVRPETRDIVLGIAAKYRESAKSFEGNIEYMAMPAPSEDEIFSIEKWEEKEQLETYCESDVCKSFIADRSPYLIDGSKVTNIYTAKDTTIDVSIRLD